MKRIVPQKLRETRAGRLLYRDDPNNRLTSIVTKGISICIDVTTKGKGKLSIIVNGNIMQNQYSLEGMYMCRLMQALPAGTHVIEAVGFDGVEILNLVVQEM